MIVVGQVRNDDLAFFAVIDEPANRSAHQRRDRLDGKLLPVRRTPVRINPLNQNEPSGYFFFLSAACVSADAATLFAVAELFGLRNTALAFDATDFDVFSFLPMTHHYRSN